VLLARGPFARKWSRRSKVFAVLAVASGSAAYLLVDGYAARLEALRPVVGDPVPVTVAAGPLERGNVLTEDDVRVDLLPGSFAPPGRIASPGSVVGQTLVSDVAEGEAITRTRIGVSGGPVASLVPEGLRAFPIQVGTSAGAVRAGDRVDVLATFGGPRPYTDTVASGLEILTIIESDDGSFSAGGDAGPSLVLLVGPEIAEELAYAVAFADLSVAVAPATEG
jgi:Flp pilus assembly protein CpaB